MRSNAFLAGLALLCLVAPGPVRADHVINFDSLPAKGNPVTGPELASYLAPFGVTISDVTPGTAVTVYDARDIYSSIQPVVPPSPFNVIAQAGSDDPVSYRLNFALPQDHFSVTRTGVRSGTSGVALPEWHAYAFDGLGHPLGTIGENAFSIFSDLPAETFTLNGPDIWSVVIASDNHHFAAFSAVILDDFTLTAVPASVPEPSGLITGTIAALVLLGHQLVRRRSRRGESGRGTARPRNDTGCVR
jgi:hypothetical protein